MMPATSVHHTATEDSTWDGPAAVAGMPNDEATLRYCHAWHEADADLDEKGAHKFPHHHTKGGPANLAAVRNGLARLSQANIPEGDRSGVEAHLRAHLEDADGTEDEDDGGEPEGDGARAAADAVELPRGLPAAVAERLEPGALKRLTARRVDKLAGPVLVDVRASRLELRERGDATARIVGYGSVYDYPYDVFGGPESGWGWTETIARGAFNKTLGERDDVRLLFNHAGLPLARTKSSTLRLASDDIGLFVEADLDLRSSQSRDVVLAMERGDLDEMSIAFMVLKDEWTDNLTKRRISEMKLFDASIVTYPASGAASAYTADSLQPDQDEDEGQGQDEDEPVMEAAGAVLTLEVGRALREAAILARK